jgi:hypothetical protein
VKFYLYVATLLPLFSFAQIQDKTSCTDVDIKKSNPKIKSSTMLTNHFTKPRNQDSIGWCYGFAAADLLSAEVGVPVSAFHTSVIYNKKVQKSFFYKMIHSKDSFGQVYEGGLTNNALKEIIKNGQVCKEVDLPFDKKYEEQTHDFIQILEEIKAVSVEPQVTCSLLQHQFKAYGLSADVQTVAASLAQENLNQTLDKLTASQCKNKMVAIPNLEVKNDSVPSVKNKNKLNTFLGNINGLLNRGKPFEVSYNVKSIMRDGSSGYHSSVVVGRRFKDGKCQYQIRNSWGQSCEPYNLQNVSCDAKTGSYWVNDELFIKMSRDINYIAN